MIREKGSRYRKIRRRKRYGPKSADENVTQLLSSITPFLASLVPMNGPTLDNDARQHAESPT